jgi:hypothetical protein
VTQASAIFLPSFARSAVIRGICGHGDGEVRVWLICILLSPQAPEFFCMFCDLRRHPNSFCLPMGSSGTGILFAISINGVFDKAPELLEAG